MEYVVNSRPITKVSDDPLDEEALCPNHLLILGEHASFPVGKFEAADKYRKQWRYVQYMADYFWRRWVKEYLPMLHGRQKWRSIQKNVKVGDLVLVMDQALPRYCWPMGVVTDVTKGRGDGLVRSVELRMRGKLMRRGITNIVMLEGSSLTDAAYED